MATISTSQTYDSAARTAGDTYTINSGAVFTVDSDTRDGKNAPAARAGSWSSFTMTAATGGQVLLDGTKVWLIKYDGLIGTPNVPALGTIIAGVTSGAYGELMNITSAINVVPTAAGLAMPATGYIKLKSVTGTFQDNETLEIQGSTDLCLANGVGARGWIEVAMDDAATFTIGRAQMFKITGDWFVSETVASGSAQQQVQFPNYGGANFFLAGCWVETGNGTNVWEFWPACLTGTGTPWSNTVTTTDNRCKFCQCLAGGILRFGGDGTNTIGKVPVAGARFRVPNVFLKSAATASRASDSVPNATLATRPDFTTTNAGQIDVDGAIGHWNMILGQAYSVKLHNFALFDQMQITECATALDLDNGGNGNYTIASDVPALVLTSDYAGGTIANWKNGRSGTIASGDYSVAVTYCNDLTFSNCIFENRTLRTNAAGYPAYNAYCNGTTFTNCTVVGGSLYITTCNDITVTNLRWSDNYFTAASTTTPQASVAALYSTDVMLNGFAWFEDITALNPNTALITGSFVTNYTIRNIGTRAAPLNVGAGSNDTTFIYTESGNCINVKIQRVYCSNVATRFISSANNAKGIIIENCAGDYADTHTGLALDQILKNFACASVPASGASVYGSIFYHIFTSTTAGRLGITFNESTATYDAYVTTSFTTSATGTSGFNSNGGLALINSGDYVIYEFPYTIKGIDSFQNSAPTITTSTNMTIQYQIDTGSGWSALKAFTAANLSAETVDEVAGLNFRIKCSANATAAANILTALYCLTNSNTTAQEVQYPLDVTVVSVVLQNVVVGSTYRIETTDPPAGTMLFEGTNSGPSTTITNSYTHTGTDVPVKIIVRKSSGVTKYLPFEIFGTITSAGLTTYVSQVEDTTSASSTSVPIGNDWTIDYTDKRIYHVQYKDVINASDASIAEITDVTVLPTSGISAGDYFNLYSAKDTTAYYVWYQIDGSGADPAPTGKTGILVGIATGNADTVVATQTRDAINTLAGDDFTATASGAVVTITNDATGSTTDASDSTGGTITGFTFTVTTQGKGKTIWSTNALYTWLQDQFDETGALDDLVPMSAQTPTEYTLINGWFIDEESIKFLKDGALQTSGWATGNAIRIVPYTQSVQFAADDIGRTIAGTLCNGKILFFDTARALVWVRPTAVTDTFPNTNAYTVAGGTGVGTVNGTSLNGENMWSNIFTLGSLVTGTTLDVYRNDAQITPWWSSEHIDVLIRVKEGGTEIDSGNVTVLARKYSTLYDHYVIDASTGRNPVPLAAFADSNNTTIEGTVGALPYTNIAFSFGAKSRDLGNDNGFQPYDVEIDCATLTLAQVYEYLKYVTRTGSTDTLNGVNGEYYQAVGDIRFTYSGASGAFSETSAITDTTTGATGYIVSWIDAGGNTGTLVVRNTHGTFANTNAITSGGTTATINSVPDTITQVKQAPFGTFAGGQFFGARGVWLTNYDPVDSNNFSLIDSTNTPQSPPLVVVLTVNGVKSAEEQLTHGEITGGDNAFSAGNYLRGVTSEAVGTIRQAVDGTHTVIGEITGTFDDDEVVNETTTGLAGDDTGDSATVFAKTTKYVRCRIKAKAGGDLPVGTQIMNEEAGTSYGSEGYYKATEVFTYTNDQPVLVRARYRGYVPFETSAVISSSDLTVTAIWQVDTNYRE